MNTRVAGPVRSSIVLLAVACLVSVPRVSVAQATEAQPDPATRFARVFQGETLELLRAQIERGRELGVPVEPLMLKALEGRSKGAPDPQVVEAVSALCHRLLRARELLGADAEAASLVAAAGALYLGVEEGAVRAMGDTMSGDAMEMGLVVLGDLVRRGVPVGDATRAMVRLGSAGLDASGFADFRDRVDSDIRTGLSPERATEVRVRGVLARVGGGMS